MFNRIHLMQEGDPRRIGPYRIVGRIGTGGMGTVYAALSETAERMAVKVVHPAQAANDEFRARFRREVELSRRVAGPCLVPLLDANPDAPAPWLVTAFIPGPTLHQYVAACGPLAGAHLYALAAGTAAALSAAHEAGVVHRDVKPQNVILAASGPMVLDFGIAHAMDGTSVTRTGVMTGTPGWISPEHYRTGTVGPEGDVFAWGALVAYAATGRLPFGSGAADAVAFRVLSTEPDLDGMDDELRHLVEMALSKEPTDRPKACELARRGRELLASQTTAVTTPASPQPTLMADLVGLNWDMPFDEPTWPAASKRISRTRLYLTTIGAAVLVGSLGGILAATQSSTTREPAAAPVGQSASVAGPTPALQQSAKPAPGLGVTASDTPSSDSPSHHGPAAPSPAYTRSDSLQPTIDEWAAARVPATEAEKAAARRLRDDATPVLQGQHFMDDQVTVTFNPSAQTMFVAFGPGSYPEGLSYQDDAAWTDIRRGLMFGSCTEAQQHFHDDITWPYGRAAVVYRKSMASPLIADFREVTHTDSCRV